MRKTIRVATTALSILTAAGLAGVPRANAQDSPDTYYGGRSVASQPTCPTIEWHILPMPFGVATNINGIAYYSDMSGISVVRGTAAADGTIAATVASVSGAGPAGAITGMRTRGETKVSLSGPGCANVTIDLRRWQPTGGGD